MNVTYDKEIDAAYIYLVSSIRTGEVAKTYCCDPNEVGGQIRPVLVAGEAVAVDIRRPDIV